MARSVFKLPQSHELSARVRSANYRARIRGVQGIITTDAVQRIWLRQRGRCLHCGTLLAPNSSVKFEIDHLIPFALGGTNDEDNIVISCVRCNRRKGQLPLEKFIRRLAANGHLHPMAYLVSELAIQLPLPIPERSIGTKAA